MYGKTILMLLTTIIIMTCSSHIVAAGKVLGGKSSEYPDWFKESFLEIAEDVAEASEENKHVMLYIYLNNCPYCHKMLEDNIKNAPYIDFIKQHFDIIAINMKGDRNVQMNDELSLTEKELATQLKVMYTPTIVFLNSNNKIVARTNGYRSVKDFKQVLNYVQQKQYEKTSLVKYLNQHKSQVYSFRDHPQIKPLTDLKNAAANPLAILFEDKACFDCDALHDKHLARQEVKDILKSFTLVRLDALSEQAIIDPQGNTTTAKAFAEELGLSYRPALVLFDKGVEIIRIQSMLYSYQFAETLRYVGERFYEKYPDSFYDYLNARTDELTKSGQDVYLSE